MSNEISLAEGYLKAIDSVRRKESLTAILDVLPFNVDDNVDDLRKFKMLKLNMQGNATIGRNGAIPRGDAVATWEEKEFTRLRGRQIPLHKADDIETLGLIMGNIGKEYMEQHEVPEADAYNLAKYAGVAITRGADYSAQADLSSADALSAWAVAQEKIGDHEAMNGSLFCFMSYETKRLIEESTKITRFSKVDIEVNGISRTFDTIDGVPIIFTPRNRFYTAISELNGTDNGEEAGGYTKADGAYDINFMLVNRDTVFQHNKYASPRLFAPDKETMKQFNADGVNPEARQWLYDFEVYGDAFVLDNKKGLYVHYKTT